jgi:hypothetical protein
MKRNVVALVTGYTGIDFLYKISFEQLRKLRRVGVIDRIVYVTWDSPRIDPLIRSVVAMDDVEVMRVAEPKIVGAPLQKSIVYQIRNLEAALAGLGVDDDTLVLKTRPDFVFVNEEFLKRLILEFDIRCAPSTLPEQLKVSASLPPPVFKRKIWVPWASASEPLFISDAVFLGLKCDIQKLADRGAERFLEILWDERCDRISHISRFLNLFLPIYPIFQRFLDDFRIYISTLDYRDYFAFLCRNQPFFWRLAVLNAWLYQTNLHIDGGRNRDLIFCSTHANPNQKPTTIRDLNFEPPLPSIDTWRKNMTAGSLMVSYDYTLAILADDEWGRALFTRDRIDSFGHDDIVRFLAEAIRYDRAEIGAIEDAFYKTADEYYQKYIAANPGILSEEGVIEHPSRRELRLRTKAYKAVADKPKSG